MDLNYIGLNFPYLLKKIKYPRLPLDKKISGLFSLKEVIPYNTAKINISKKITVITDSKQCSYSAFFPLISNNAEKENVFSSAVLILIRAIIKKGGISIGCIKNDFKSFADDTIQIQKDVMKTSCLLVDPLKECSGLMVRNYRDDDESSIIEIHSIDVYTLKRICNREKVSSPSELHLKPVKNWSRYYGITPHSMIEKIRLWEYKEIDIPKIMPWIRGLKIKIYPGNEIHEALYLSGLYEPNTMLVLQKLLSPGDTFFDVGANIGCFSLYAARIVGSKGRVFAFEPSFREYKRLTENVKLNKLQNVKTINAALSDSESKTKLNIACERHSGHNTLGENFIYKGVESVATEEVDTITIDKFVYTRSLGKIDMIKLDIEGWEYKALTGAQEVLKKYRPALIVEVIEKTLYDNRNPISQLEPFLSNLGYSFYEIDEETADLSPISFLSQSHSQNIIAMFD
ncbi:FkbM family methyltransferase [Candidatus Latescibacterota bacterium]